MRSNATAGDGIAMSLPTGGTIHNRDEEARLLGPPQSRHHRQIEGPRGRMATQVRGSGASCGRAAERDGWFVGHLNAGNEAEGYGERLPVHAGYDGSEGCQDGVPTATGVNQ
jgi:hypothetical protein